MGKVNVNDKIHPEGLVEIFVYHDKKLHEYIKEKNIILYQGNAQMITTVSQTSPSLFQAVINRMCIGDQGATPLNPQVPKVPTQNMTGLFNEIYREDIQAKTITTSGATNSCQFVATFNASNIPLSAYSNPATPQTNEVGLVFIQPGAPAGLVRAPVIAPAAPPSDEVVASIRTFKSIPFDAANDVQITVRYTLFMM